MRTRSIQLAGMALAVVAVTSAPAHAQVKAGAEFRANTSTTGQQIFPGIAVQSNGDFIVTWGSSVGDASGYGALGQRYFRDGSPKGAQFQINSYATGNQLFTDVAIAPSGAFLVVWDSRLTPTTSTVRAQFFDAAGAKVGADFEVNPAPGTVDYYAHAGSDAKGNFVVTWTSDAAGGDTSYYGILARRFAANGTPLGAPFQVNTFTNDYQEKSKIAVNADGSFVVVWESYLQDGSSYAVVGQRFDAAGTRVGSEFVANTYTTGNQGDPSVGAGADGRFVIAWESNMGPSPNGLEVRSQRFDASGTPVGGEFIVNSYTTGSQFLYSVAVDAQGNFVTVWDETGRDGSDYGSFGWRTAWNNNARRGAEFQSNTFTTGYQGISNVAGDPLGNFIVAWHSDQDGGPANLGIYVQRFGGLFPTALSVDSTGNLVWDPNETVEVKPSWRNQNGASQTFGSSLADITGPAGATYAITDPTADYGTVTNGATATCTDCFGVLNVIVNRPQQHIDASAVESITPDTQGQQKTWKLHVGGSFADVSGSSPFYRFIETLLHYSITGGCGGNDYCPLNSTTRDQMSVFVLVAKEGAGYAPPACSPPNVFNDVPETNPFCRFIEELAARGVVSGCGGGNYCPGDPVTREQMAVFVLRTLDPTLNPPACGTPVFTDVPASSGFCKWIEELVRRNVVTGCAPNLYCPTQPVTREQMGVFISGTFGLTLYGI